MMFKNHLSAILAATSVAIPATLSAQTPSFPPASLRPAAHASQTPMGQPAMNRQGPSAAAKSPTGIFLNMPQFEIPFSVAATGTQPQEVHLYMSRDAGARWELFARQPASSRNFPFSAPADGDYWFATRTIDSNGAAHPSGPVQPQLRVTVDTVNPELEARADADGNGQVIVDYRIADLAPLADSLRIEYMTDSVRQWMPVESTSQPIFREQQGSAEGRVVWVPEADWRHVYIRLIVRDRAGNQTVLTRQVEKPRMAKQPVPAQLASSPLLPPPPLPNDAPPMYANPAAIAAMAASHSRSGPLTGAPQSQNIANQPFNPVYTPAAQAWNAGQPSAAQPRATAPAPAPTAWPTTPPQPQRVAQNQPQRQPQPAPAATFEANNAPAAQPAPATSYVADAAPRSAVRGMAPSTTQDFNLNAPAARPAPATQPAPATRPAAEMQPAPAPQPTFAAQSAPTPAVAPQADPEPQAPRTAEDALRPLAVDGREVEIVPAPAATPDTFATTTAPPTTPPTPDAAQPQAQPASQSAAHTPLHNAQRITMDDLASSGAAVRQSDSRTFSLDYELEAVGRQGVDTVELWATKDAGKTWVYWDADPDGQSPFDIITAGDGAYGFRIVVVAQNGLASPRPQAGDDADIYVLVDTTKPNVRITGARYGDQDDTGKLLIQYECEDPHGNLARRPITLKFSDSPAGPWTTIATGLDNDGFYAWPADPELPHQIYLRIEAADRAENIGHYTLDRPIAVEGLAPRARIRGFQPVREETAAGPQARFK